MNNYSIVSMFKRHYISSEYTKVICNIICDKITTEIIFPITKKDSIYTLTDLNIILFFGTIMNTQFDICSLHYNPTMFTFNEDGFVIPSMFNRLIFLQVKYNINKKYIIPNNEFNIRYFLKFFPNLSLFNIIDSDSTVHCYNTNYTTARDFLIFVNVFSKNNNSITCKVKYKIYF